MKVGRNVVEHFPTATLAAPILAGALGMAIGIGAYTFVYAKGASYLTDRPEACANCHIMRDHFNGWVKSSHRQAAVCNDCHTPTGLMAKYLAKASNGLRHSWAFTAGTFPEPLRIKPHNRSIAEEKCRACHGDIVEAIDPFHEKGKALQCTRCHAAVGHPS
ncbi:MAG TPA: cytochrome c nitrite reductase small subunit [Candidatus Acidoferrales bacterium]|nr:cytochrome c nitrite reductase small subunit [Candidatus Acidoferrales bacterium]